MFSEENTSLVLRGITNEKYQSDIAGILHQIEELKKHFQPKEPTEYLTPAEVAEMFSVDISTIHNWKVKGTLQAYSLEDSRRVYYKRSEVESSIVKLNN